LALIYQFSPTSQVYNDYAITVGGYGPSLPPKTDIAFVLTLTECPEHVNPDSNLAKYQHQDPARGFYDAAAILRYLVCEECKELNYASKYSHHFYAIVHPAAQYCTDSRDGRGTYDRVKVLQQLGYRVEIKGSPVWGDVVTDPYLQANASNDMGFRDLMKLHAYTLTRHQVVVVVDFTTIILEPLDAVIDQMLESESIKASFAYDYATESPALELQRGVNTNLLFIKPSYDEYNTLVQLYKTETYNETMGWGGHGVGNFAGALGASGLLAHYYRSNQDSYIELDKCLYSNQVENPVEESTGYCQDGSEPPCEDCRLKSIHSITAGRLNRVCGRPWECPWSGEAEVIGPWDGPTQQLCTALLTEWFTKRLRFEENHWTGPTSNRTGSFHPDVFLGYCHGPGLPNYEQIVKDQSLAPTASPTSSPTRTPTTASPSPAPVTSSQQS
jgi:hypothetical protein